MKIRGKVFWVTVCVVGWPHVSSANSCIPRYMDCDPTSPGGGSILGGFLIVVGVVAAIGIFKALAEGAPLLPKWLQVLVLGVLYAVVTALFLGICFMAYVTFQSGNWVLFGFFSLMIYAGLREFIREHL